MRKSTKIVALDQHMDSITVAVAEPGRRPPELSGDIANTPEAVAKLTRRLSRLRNCDFVTKPVRADTVCIDS